jgi:hypothetical protein
VSAISESVPMGAWQLAVCAAVVVCAVAGAVFSARYHIKRDAGQVTDAVFWDGFAGTIIVLPAIVIPSLASPWSGRAMAAVAAVTAVAAYLWSPGLMARHESRRHRSEAESQLAEAAARHRTVLARWQRYELDPAYSIDFPDMTDVRRPETAALIKAMKAAERLRRESKPAAYPSAVAQLEHALIQAEGAAGVPLPRGLHQAHATVSRSPARDSTPK